MYSIQPLSRVFGAQVTGINLASVQLRQELIQQIKHDLKAHRLLVFKDQGKLSGERQVEVSRKLGTIESTFYKHPRSPHDDVFRVSNDEREGCTNVGRTGWHIDGTFQERPFKYQTMHFHSVIDGGDTLFIPLRELYERQPPQVRDTWDQLWFVTGREPVHPLTYLHPERGDTTLLFHCGGPFCAGWASMAESQTPQDVKGLLPPQLIQQQLTDAIWEAMGDLGHRQQWSAGDFAIIDNLGVAHYADAGTQQPPSPGSRLRILHRTTIAGETVPTKADGRQSFHIGAEQARVSRRRPR